MKKIIKNNEDNKSTSNNILMENSNILEDIDDSMLDENNYFSVAYLNFKLVILCIKL